MCVQFKSDGFRVIPGKYRCVCSSRVRDSEWFQVSLGVCAAQECRIQSDSR